MNKGYLTLTVVAARLGRWGPRIVRAIVLPRLVEKTIEIALTDGGHSARTTLFKATGFLPSGTR